MQQTQPVEIPESRLVRNDRKKETKVQLIKVLALTTVLLALLLYLLIANLPGLFQRGDFRFLFSIYRLTEPASVSVSDAGGFYVSEPQRNRLMAFDGNGELVRVVSQSKGKGRVGAVFGSVVDEDRGEIYAADFMERAIHVFDKNGKFVRKFPDKPFNRIYGEKGFVPYDVALYDNKVYAATRNGLAIFNRKGQIQEIWGRERGVETGEFNFINGIAIDQESGDIFVSDSLNRRVVALNRKGQVKWTTGKPDKGTKLISPFSLPRGIAIDAWGRLFVADTFEHRLVVLNQDGSFVTTIGERGVEDGQFNFPEGLSIANNRLAVADRSNGRVQVFNLGWELPKASGHDKRDFAKALTEAKKDGFLAKIDRLKFVNGKLAPGQKI
jgi:DNA-binding beta-propeller fold protein YncE